MTLSSQLAEAIEDQLVEALPDGTVKTFLMVLRSAITQWDVAESAKAAKRRGGFHSPYALSLMLGAAEKVERDVTSVLSSSSPEDLARLKASIEHNFTKQRWRDGVLKKIDDFVSSGKLPSLKK